MDLFLLQSWKLPVQFILVTSLTDVEPGLPSGGVGASAVTMIPQPSLTTIAIEIIRKAE